MVINAYVNVWLLIPAGIMTVLFYLMRLVYVNTGRSFKRIEALSKFTNLLIRKQITEKTRIFIHYNFFRQAEVRSSLMWMQPFKVYQQCVHLMLQQCLNKNSMNFKITIRRVGTYLSLHHDGLRSGWMLCAFSSSLLWLIVFSYWKIVGWSMATSLYSSW